MDCPQSDDVRCTWCEDRIPDPGHPGGGAYPDDAGEY